MTLKNFHLVFIACSTALTLLFGAWALTSPTLVGPARFAAALGALTAGLALVAYERWFLRYSKEPR
jgi:hypothetical protein